jgi:RHS repeat-associated protein
VISNSSGASTGTLAFFPFGLTRSSTGTIPTDELFTGQRLDSTGLYYYGARYYDPTIGRFVSPDTFNLDFSYPQGFNRYSYVFNNPLRLTDPTGNWPPWDQIKSAASTVVSGVKQGLQVAQTKIVETYNKVTDVIETGGRYVSETTGRAIKRVNVSVGEAGLTAEKAISNVPNLISDSAGIEGISHINTSAAQDVRVIDIKQGSPLDKVLPDAVTLYPLGVFTNDPMSAKTQEHEGYHWMEQSSAGPFLPMWYSQYIYEYSLNWIAYGFNGNVAHDVTSFEQRANDYAGIPTYHPSIVQYWWDKLFP